MMPVGGRTGSPGVSPPGGSVAIGGCGRAPGSVGRPKSGKSPPIGGRVGMFRPGSWIFGGMLQSRFWFCVSIRQGLPSLVSSSLCVPPLPSDTTGEVERCRRREGGTPSCRRSGCLARLPARTTLDPFATARRIWCHCACCRDRPSRRSTCSWRQAPAPPPGNQGECEPSSRA